jgi:predicted transcriptional regulator
MQYAPNTEANIEAIREELKCLKGLIGEKVTLTTVEFSERTGLDERTISKYCRIGALKSIQLVKGGNYLIAISELERILELAAFQFNKRKKLSTASLNKIKQGN